jgi:hypothetical protein
MMTSTDPSAQAVRALDAGGVLDSDGSEIGKVYTDNGTGPPTWVTVRTGWFDTNEAFVPLNSATIEGDTIQVPYDKDMIMSAPNNDAGAPLSETNERQPYSCYGRTSTTGRAEKGTTGIPSPTQTVDSGEYLTRSEEQLHVGTERVETGRARLRKVVVTEQQTITVPVTRKEVRLVGTDRRR